jgi:hypothetical protein
MMLWDINEHRSKAAEYTRLAEAAASGEKREHYLRMAQSSLVMARNAEWIRSTDEFLVRWKRH